MSSYLSNLLTQGASHYKTLRRTLLSTEEDGDTEDDSHITRVLRAYYTEKGRPFPAWLPPDPNEKDKPEITAQPYLQTASSYINSTLGRNQPAAQARPPNPSNATRSSLNDLFDGPSTSAPQSQSLRGPRGPAPVSASRNNVPASLTPAPQALPLPSQRAGSYQSFQSQAPSRPSFDPTPPGSSGGGGTAQDRLKARLWGPGGARSGSPSSGGYQPSSNSGNSYYGR